VGLLSPTAKKQCALYVLCGRQRPPFEQNSTSVAVLYDQQREERALSNPSLGVAGHRRTEPSNKEAARVGSLSSFWSLLWDENHSHFGGEPAPPFEPARSLRAPNSTRGTAPDGTVTTSRNRSGGRPPNEPKSRSADRGLEFERSG